MIEGGFWARARRAMQNPSRAILTLWSRLLPGAPVPIRLPFGAWWFAGNDYSGRMIRGGTFENAEFLFAYRFLAPGMTVLDIGAHHGFYTLLASTRVGAGGSVVSFEPSPRERAALLRHIKWNRRRNVLVQGVALGSEQKSANLFVIDQNQTGCNSLRPPASDVHETWTPTPVQVITLDGWLAGRSINLIDFVKLDVEGGELDVLKGARILLACKLRPVFLIEVQDIRSERWGYPANELIDFLAQRGFGWYEPSADGSLRPLDVSGRHFEGNFVAWPEEREPQRLAAFIEK